MPLFSHGVKVWQLMRRKPAPWNALEITEELLKIFPQEERKTVGLRVSAICLAAREVSNVILLHSELGDYRINQADIKDKSKPTPRFGKVLDLTWAKSLADCDPNLLSEEHPDTPDPDANDTSAMILALTRLVRNSGPPIIATEVYRRALMFRSSTPPLVIREMVELIITVVVQLVTSLEWAGTYWNQSRPLLTIPQPMLSSDWALAIGRSIIGVDAQAIHR